jgi:tRNA(Ile)-lysidine synthase
MAPAFSTTLLGESLTRLLGNTSGQRCCVAFSGGVDSTALLHALAKGSERLGIALRAVHVNHHLQPQSDAWAEHCRRIADQLAVPLCVLEVKVRAARGESIEAAARHARYTAIAAELGAAEHLITAHHREDQMETILLRLMRGAGATGLAGMPQAAPFAQGLLLRPLLGIERAALIAYCQAARLPWIEDASNADTRFDRNYLRGRVIPALRERWPAVAECVTRSGAHLAEARALLDERAHEDLALARDGDALRVTALRGLSPARARNLLRFWIENAGEPAPSSAVLDQVMVQMLDARPDAMPLIVMGKRELRRYRDVLYLCRPPPSRPRQALTWAWREHPDIELPGGLGRLRLQTAETSEAVIGVPAGPLTVRWGSAALKLQLTPRGARKTLRNLFQERGVVPWMRPYLPLVFAGDALVAVADLWSDVRFQPAPGEPRMTIEWLDHPQLF